jgi:hypothetical protein
MNTQDIRWQQRAQQFGKAFVLLQSAIKQAFQSGLIDKGHDWIDALEDRNLTSHT